MKSDKETMLQRVARKAKVTEQHVRAVHCGAKPSRRITKMLIAEKEAELKALRKSIIRNGVQDFNNTYK